MSGVRKASVPTTLKEMDEYEFVVNTEVTNSTLKSGWSTGVASGTVETGFINDEPDMSSHYSKGMALVRQVSEVRAQRKKEEEGGHKESGERESSELSLNLQREKTSREAFIHLDEANERLESLENLFKRKSSRGTIDNFSAEDLGSFQDFK